VLTPTIAGGMGGGMQQLMHPAGMMGGGGSTSGQPVNPFEGFQ
jgi:hypothetical protein